MSEESHFLPVEPLTSFPESLFCRGRFGFALSHSPNFPGRTRRTNANRSAVAKSRHPPLRENPFGDTTGQLPYRPLTDHDLGGFRLETVRHDAFQVIEKHPRLLEDPPPDAAHLSLKGDTEDHESETGGGEEQLAAGAGS